MQITKVLQIVLNLKRWVKPVE